MKIEACINCGSMDIRSGTISDGVLPGYTDGLVTFVCRNCNHRGIPVIFDSEEEYTEFAKVRGEAYEKERSGEETEEDNSEKTGE